jgi:predicted RNase H-like nuclease (RuvC/YqgF family)
MEDRVNELTMIANDLAPSLKEVDDKVEALEAENKRLREALDSKNKYIEHLGEISDTCTERETGKICSTCRCPKAQSALKGE